MEGTEIFVPGRTELGGNHTDHQGGCVLAAGVSLGMTALAAPNGTDTVNIRSRGFGEFSVDIGDTEPRPEEAGTSAALIRGVCGAFIESGNVFGGFDAEVESEIPAGSGLSSSAAFEVLIGRIIDRLFFGKTVPPAALARMAQHAENVYFGKPCGLMDQLVCAVGGIVSASFADPKAPQYRQIDYDFAESGHALAIIECGVGHENLTADYAQITKDMRLIAVDLGHERLCEATAAEFYSVFPILRQRYGDRPAFRALHFFEETRRAAEEADALSAGDFDEFLRLYRESAESSEQYLQNIVSENEPQHRLQKAIAAARSILSGAGAVRVHGGGFAGTAQAFVPVDMKQKFSEEMQSAGFACLWPEII